MFYTNSDATGNETKHEIARRRYQKKQESRRRDREFYRRWLNSTGTRW